MTDDRMTVTLPHPSGKGQIEYEVWEPTPEQLLVFAAEMSDQTRIAAAVFEILGDVFEPEDLTEIRTRLRARRNDPARLTIEDLMALVEQLMEAASDFPTQQSSASPSRPSSTGRKSTGRVHSAALTPSGSQRAAS